MSSSPFKADLHCHTTCSDGSMTPFEIMHHAKKIGLNALCITDHDTVEAYKEALPIAKELNIEMISGVEFSSYYEEHSVHILGYSFNLENPNLEAFCQKHRLRRSKRNLAILEKLAKKGMVITEEELIINPNERTHSIGRPHIAMALVNRGYARSIRDAFNLWIGEDRPCFDLGERFTAEETIDVIHQAGGVAVIAHPHLIEEEKVVSQLLEMPFDGIEVYYARFSEAEIQKWKEIAKKRDFLMTGGSDFHGTVKNIALGSSWAPEESFRYLQQKYAKHFSI